MREQGRGNREQKEAVSYQLSGFSFKSEKLEALSSKLKASRGFGLLEVVVSIGIIATILIVLVTSLSSYIRVGLQNTDALKATYLAEEGIEVARFFRDASWDGNVAPLPVNTSYYIVFATTTVSTSTTPTLVDGFTRTIKLQSVYRKNSDSDIVASTSPLAKTLDPDARQVEVSVTWDTKYRHMTTYLTDLFEN